MAVSVIGDAGRNKHKQRLVKVRCDCGREKVVIANNLKSGRVRTCGKCRAAAPTPAASKPVPTPAQYISVPAATPGAQLERGTVAWYRDQIAIKEAAALKLEAQANEFELELRTNGIQPTANTADPPDKLWARAVNTAKKLRAEIAQLTTDMQKREAAAAEKPVTDTTRDRIARLQGGRK